MKVSRQAAIAGIWLLTLGLTACGQAGGAAGASSSGEPVQTQQTGSGQSNAYSGSPSNVSQSDQSVTSGGVSSKVTPQQQAEVQSTVNDMLDALNQLS